MGCRARDYNKRNSQKCANTRRGQGKELGSEFDEDSIASEPHSGCTDASCVADGFTSAIAFAALNGAKKGQSKPRNERGNSIPKEAEWFDCACVFAAPSVRLPYPLTVRKLNGHGSEVYRSVNLGLIVIVSLPTRESRKCIYGKYVYKARHRR